MLGAKTASPYTCSRCLRAPQRCALRSAPQSRRWLSGAGSSPQRAQAEPEQDDGNNNNNNNDSGNGTATPAKNKSDAADAETEQGAMSRRLSSLRDGSESVSHSDGFDPELRARLEARIASANFTNEYAGAISQANLPGSAGRGTRDIAGAQAWTGEEALGDGVLRMLDDGRKKLKGSSGSGTPRAPLPSIRMPATVDTGHTRGKGGGQGVKLANARDKTSVYASMKDVDMSPEEREKLRREMRERFQPHARAVPASLQGLASLANERIEDAIARGQFRNLPRGKELERDYAASSPFLDTTEYFMNKIIQKQEIVPPWIEKQQELVQAAGRFRARLRSDWGRHAARVIASRGGELGVQVERARAYARAEVVWNPKVKKGDAEREVAGVEGKLEETGAGTAEPIASASPTAPNNSTTPPPSQPSPPPTPTPAVAAHPFRDPTWEHTEHAYLTASITHLNSLTRSYNLMAPSLAQKPYFALDRELRAAFADVAPTLPDAIMQRALAPRRKDTFGTAKPGNGGVLDNFSLERGRVYEERVEKRYGFKEWWREVRGMGWGGKGGG